jgi:SM-20-related protein
MAHFLPSELSGASPLLAPLPEQALEGIARDLTQRGYTLLPHLLADDDINSLREEAQALREQRLLQPASIGRNAQRLLASDQRNDSTCWLEETPQTAAQKKLWERWSQIAHALNQRLFLGLSHFEAHWAVYPVGGFYRKHLDRFRDDDARVLSAVFYLNSSDWKTEDGGALRIWPANEPENSIDINPESGLLVLFLSDQIPHEVLPTRRERYSIAAWFRRSQSMSR